MCSQHRCFLPGGTERLDIRYYALPVGMAEGCIGQHDVIRGNAFCLKKIGQHDIGGAWIDIVRAGQYPPLHRHLLAKKTHCGQRLLVGRRAQIEDIVGALHTFILHRIEQQPVQFLYHRLHR